LFDLIVENDDYFFGLIVIKKLITMINDQTLLYELVHECVNNPDLIYFVKNAIKQIIDRKILSVLLDELYPDYQELIKKKLSYMSNWLTLKDSDVSGLTHKDVDPDFSTRIWNWFITREVSDLFYVRNDNQMFWINKPDEDAEDICELQDTGIFEIPFEQWNEMYTHESQIKNFKYKIEIEQSGNQSDCPFKIPFNYDLYSQFNDLECVKKYIVSPRELKCQRQEKGVIMNGNWIAMKLKISIMIEPQYPLTEDQLFQALEYQSIDSDKAVYDRAMRVLRTLICRITENTYDIGIVDNHIFLQFNENVIFIDGMNMLEYNMHNNHKLDLVMLTKFDYRARMAHFFQYNLSQHYYQYNQSCTIGMGQYNFTFTEKHITSIFQLINDDILKTNLE
jgi:hypothetical protein